MMEEQHPIPQQISSYQFRLVGDMTLKQFFQVAGGGLVALVLYSSPLPFYLKWPGIITSFLFGIALAFFPIQDRSLATWLFAFFKSIYSPTIYQWQYQQYKEPVFQPETTPQTPVVASAETVEPEVKVVPVAQVVDQNQTPTPTEDQSLPTTPINPQLQVKPEPELTAPIRPEKIEIPDNKAVLVEKQEKEEQPSTPAARQEPFEAGSFIAPAVGTPTATKQATFTSEASPPSPPTKPNIVVGQVLDKNGKIVENAILEIKDEEGRSVRALRSNKLGHFMIVTPLTNGKYEIDAEREGFTFEPVRFTTKGDIIEPIAITAKPTADSGEKEKQNKDPQNNLQGQTIYSQ